MNPIGTYRIVPTQTGRLILQRVEDRLVLGERDFPNQQAALEALQEIARRGGLEVTLSIRPDGRIDRVRVGPSVLSDRPDVPFTLPASVADILADSAEAIGVVKAEALRRSVLLLKLAVDAESEGNHLAILSPEDDVLQDVLGFGPASEPGLLAEANAH